MRATVRVSAPRFDVSIVNKYRASRERFNLFVFLSFSKIALFWRQKRILLDN